MPDTQACTDAFVTVADTKVQLSKGGSGPPLLWLHGAGGSPGWLGYHRALAEHFTVYAPAHPGFNTSERPAWLETITDMAHFYLQFIDTLELGPLTMIGSSMGGWIAAEMAAMCAHQLKALVLVDAVGIKPQVGEITEILMISREEAHKLRFYDPSQVPNYDTVVASQQTPEAQEVLFRNQEMASRLCWKPYMHNPKLPAYLRRVQTPTLVIWGRQDAIVPLNCGELYQQALPHARLRVIEHCGHSPQLEKPQEFLREVLPFLQQALR